VRFFLGYGLVFIVQSALTILLGAAAMFLLQPGLAALALIPVPFVVVISARYGRRSRPALQEVQQRIAELTADVEENVSAVRVVQAVAAEDRQLERFRGSVLRVFDQSMIATRMRAFYNPFIGFLPNLGLAIILLVGGREVVKGTLSLGDFTAFYSYLLMLIGPMRQLGVALGLAQRATDPRKRSSWRGSAANAFTTRSPETFSSTAAVSSAIRCWTSCSAGRDRRP
jgi:ABC-type multidrug transport system fused ATPase/permease subunit